MRLRLSEPLKKTKLMVIESHFIYKVQIINSLKTMEIKVPICIFLFCFCQTSLGLKFAAVDLISGAFGLRLEVLDELFVDDDFRSGSTLVVAGYSLAAAGCSLGGADNECPPAATMCPGSDSQFCSYVSIRRCRR